MVLHSTRWLALITTYFLATVSSCLSGASGFPDLWPDAETIGMLLGAGLVSRFLGSLLDCAAGQRPVPSYLFSAHSGAADAIFALAFWIGHQVVWLMVIIVGF